MVEASKPRRLHPTSILYTCKVFHQFDMLWMDMWVQPDTDMPLKVGVDFFEKLGASTRGVAESM